MKQRTPFQRIKVEEAIELAGREDALLLDVRTADAFAREHVAGAQHATLSGLSPLIMGTEKTRPIVIYCYRGNASQEYAQAFSDFGFAEVYSVDGGFEAWSQHKTAAASSLDAKLRQWLAAYQYPDGQIDSVAGNGTTPLMKASHIGDDDVVRLLIAAGASLNARNHDGNNALWLACVGGRMDIIDLLAAAGVDIDNSNDNGATALMYAASAGKADVVARLLAHGADIALESLDGFTALDMAATVECLAHLRQADRAKRQPVAAGSGAAQ
jgi:thiosulfate/3-mercaptopyruvate sulfurtransferase